MLIVKALCSEQQTATATERWPRTEIARGRERFFSFGGNALSRIGNLRGEQARLTA